MAKSGFANIVSRNREFICTRRNFLSGTFIGFLVSPCSQITGVQALEQPLTEITQPRSSDDSSFINRAFEMKKLAQHLGDQPYGAVVVRGNKIIGQSWSRVIGDQDPTGHAEMSAIRNASQRLKERNLSGAVLYSSSRPCPMCEAAAFWAGIDQMIFGSAATKAGAPKLCA